jgi:hypothetical protein
MRLVKKYNVPDNPEVLQVISSDTFKSILRCYISQDSTLADNKRVHDVLATARDSDAWLECDCRPPLSAFLYPRRLADDRYTLVRPAHDSAHYHLPSCQFHSVPLIKAPNDDTPNFNLIALGATPVFANNRYLHQILGRVDLCSIKNKRHVNKV